MSSLISLLPPPGSQGKGERPGPAEGAAPADGGDPPGARRSPGPLGPTRRRAPPQGRGAVRDPPAPLVAGAGDPGGTAKTFVLAVGRCNTGVSI